MARQLFGTDGVRGVAGEKLTAELLYRLNRWVFFRLLRLIARRRGAEQRLILIEKAIDDGESGRLGLNRAYPL